MKCKYIAILCLLLLSMGCGQSTDSEAERWANRAENVTIIRDDFGVPHIYGKSDADAVFGLLYAQCEDDFNRVEQNYIWAIGRLAEVEGPDALYSDLRARLFMTKEEAIEQYNNSPEWLQELCDAFADGINYYLYTHPEVTPKLLDRFEPWMPMYFSEGSIGGDIERVSLGKLRAFYAERYRAPAVPQEVEEALTPEPGGSNGVAISGELTESGNTLLLINPHTSFYFRGEVHVVSEEGLNAYGAVTWGQFFVYQGFNEHTGWMHTSTYTDVIDEFVEDVIEIDSTLYYRYGETLKPVKQDTLLLKYAEGGNLKTASFPTFETHHGPVTHLTDGKLTATAMMWEPAKALEQSYLRTKQEGYEGFRKMMDIRTNSSNNTVYADSGGNIAYFHGNFIPRRDTIFDYSQPVDGSNPATDWQGLHTVDEQILILNPKNGWIQNCNSTPYTAALEFSPKRGDYPGYMSVDNENFRGVHAIGLLRDARDLTLDKLITMAHDPYLPGFTVLIPGLVSAFDKLGHPNPDLKQAVDVLREWDYKTSKASVGMTLSHFYGSVFSNRSQRPEGLSDMEWITFLGSSSPEADRLAAFDEVITRLEKDFGTWEIPWGEVNRYQRLNGDIMQAFNDSLPSIPIGFASGRWGALAAYGARYHNNTKKIYGTRGNSFVAVVEFGEKVKAKSILAGGQSGNPKSPHFDDQAQRYADVEFKEVPFYKADVLKRAKEEYHPGAPRR